MLDGLLMYICIGWMVDTVDTFLFRQSIPIHAYFPLIRFARLTTAFPRSLAVSILYVM